MRRILIVVTVAAYLAALVSFSIPVAGAQEEPLPDLTVEKTGPTTVAAGDAVRYQIVVTNIGAGDAAIPAGTVLLRDELGIYGRQSFWETGGGGCPPHFSGISFQGGGRVAGTFTTDHTVNNPAVLPSGGTCSFSTGAGLQNPGRITNCATVDPDNAIRESDETNNTSCVTTRVGPDRGDSTS
jgi:uncharacterized repeat protein (TIGR01451 family)